MCGLSSAFLLCFLGGGTSLLAEVKREVKVLLLSIGCVEYIKAVLLLCVALGVCGSRGKGGFSSL